MIHLSIIIPTKNRPDHLRRALQSLSDLNGSAEITVVDDGSSDENQLQNENICKGINRCRYLLHERSRGASAARNHGFHCTSGAYVWFLDDDDYPSPPTVRDVLRAVTSNTDKRVLLLPRAIVADGTPIRLDVPGDHSDKFELYRCSGVEVTTSCAVFPREAVSRVNGWDESLPSLQDADLFLRVAQIAQFTYLPTTPVRVDVSAPTRITNAFRNSQIGKLKFLRKHWRILPTRRRLLYLAQILGCSPLWRASRVRRQLSQAKRRAQMTPSHSVTTTERPFAKSA